jgi:hypothetical protein
MKTSLKIKITKERVKKEWPKATLIVVGAGVGLGLSKLSRWLTEDQPTMNAIASYAMPPILAGGGFLLCAGTEDDNTLKYFGYGLATAGVIDGVRLLPFGKDFLSGILGNAEISADKEFLNESEERRKMMGSFGQNALPVGKASMQLPDAYKTELPELAATEDSTEEGNGSDLGYNGSFTDDADSFGSIL